MLLCFDLDNTLVHSNRIHVEAFNLSFKMNGLPPVSSKKLISHFGKVGTALVKGIFPKISEDEAVKVVKDHNRIVLEDTARYVKIIPGVKAALINLKKTGFKLALLSNCSHPEIEAILKRAKIGKDLFDIIIGSDEVLHPKPWPDEILKAKARLHAKKYYMIGDTTYDVETGKKAGAGTISVLTGDHTRGMIGRAKPDYVIRSVAELPKLLTSLAFGS